MSIPNDTVKIIFRVEVAVIHEPFIKQRLVNMRRCRKPVGTQDKTPFDDSDFCKFILTTPQTYLHNFKYTNVSLQI